MTTDSYDGGKSKKWLRGRVEKCMFTARYIRVLEMMRMSSDQLAEMLNPIEPEISKQSDSDEGD